MEEGIIQGTLQDDGMTAPVRRQMRSSNANKMLAQDHEAHDWYRFVLSYPPHLVRDYIRRFGLQCQHRLLDPFCGTGTTLVEAKKLGIDCVGIEANPMAYFASRVKLNWTPSPTRLVEHAEAVAEAARDELLGQGIHDTPIIGRYDIPNSLRCLSQEKEKLILKDSISPLPLHKVLVLLECLDRLQVTESYDHERLALAKVVVFTISNLSFGPEVGVGDKKNDVAVISPWLKEVRSIARDITHLQQQVDVPATVYNADARQILQVLTPTSVDGIITSPPYPNEKDYTRTTRLESVLLGFIQSKSDLRAVKDNLVRSNTRSVYKTDMDDQWVESFPQIQAIADAIEARRIELGKTSGFERLYGRVTKLYFGGMARHLAELRSVLRPGAHLAYVVGDQASYLRVMIRTGEILGQIAVSLGYDLLGLDLFRTRLATATREQLREEVVVLRWSG